MLSRFFIGLFLSSTILFAQESYLNIDADFFELGGHSLKATILVSKIHKIFDVKIALAEIFKQPTIIDVLKLILLLPYICPPCIS